MTGSIHLQIAAVLIRHQRTILLVEQQGAHDTSPNWALPGGVVERGELPTEAALREVAEETGLVVSGDLTLLYVMSSVHPAAGDSICAFVFEATSWSGTLAPNDPDGVLLQARFLPEQDAIAKLENLPGPMMREPILAHLREEAGPGALWLYRYSENDAQLMCVVPSAASVGMR